MRRLLTITSNRCTCRWAACCWRNGTASERQREFDIVRHLNFASTRITDPIERLALAQLNLIAGQRAKSATAYEVALVYFKTGIDLLTDAP